MLINLKFIDIQQAGRECLKRQLEIEEASIPDKIYLIPKVDLKKVKMTKASLVGLAGTMFKSFIP